MRLVYIFLLVIISLPISNRAQESTDNAQIAFEQANKAYASSNYDIAIIAYNEILKQGKHSAEVYFNLANAYYKKNEVGPAIYNYEKALLLDPDHAEVQTNLRFANQMKIDAIEALPENKVSATVNEVIRSLDVDEWAYISIVCVLFTILCYILFVYAATSGKKRLFFILVFIGLLLVAVTIAAAFYAKNDLNSEQFGIVYEAEFKTRSEPKNTSEVSFIIHEGTKVQVLQEFENWSEIKLANGSVAWMPSSMIKML